MWSMGDGHADLGSDRRRSLTRRRSRPRAPDINAGEQEQPDHVDKMPVPGGGLEAEMPLRVKCPAMAWYRITVRKIVPMMTCAP